MSDAVEGEEPCIIHPLYQGRAPPDPARERSGDTAGLVFVGVFLGRLRVKAGVGDLESKLDFCK